MTTKPVLTARDFELASQALGCEVAAIRAIDAVESRGHGFLPDGQVVILFEGHIFSRLTGGKYDKSHPTISYPEWTKKFYRRDTYGEHERLQQAVALDRNAALQSASWGRFQLLGEGWGYYCGYPSLQAFIAAMHRSEQDQLKGFCEFIRRKRDKQGTLQQALRDKNWRRVAYLYNGAGYEENAYHIKLAQAYARFS